MRSQNRRGKRSHASWQEEEPEVDDLAVAATFAQVTTLLTKQEEHPQGEVPHDSSESEVESDNEEKVESNSESHSETAGGPRVNEEDDIDPSDDSGEADEDSSSDDSDGESDVDLTEALARMEDEERPKKNGASSHAPTTENELDPYRTPITDLETKFQLNLTVEEQERLRLEESALPASSGGPIQLCAAGHVKCHMIVDRTIVVESVGTGSAPLDEGSLLVFRVQDEPKGDEKVQSRLLPIGKVFEVFGPVSSPLYTVRLPAFVKAKPAKKNLLSEQEITGNFERDADEISLDEDESCGEGGNETTAAAPSIDAVNNVEEKKEKDDVGDAVIPEDSSDVDPWSPEGDYTKLIQNTNMMPVYYIPDVAKLLDTGAIIRNSGRGCDASNLYDEEVVNINEMEFSDDEEEREFKNRNKRGRKGRRNSAGPQSRTGGREPAAGVGRTYTGFHPQQPPSYPPQAVSPAHYPPHATNQYQQQYAPPGTAYPFPNPNQYPHQQAPQGFAGQPQYAYYPGYSQGTVPPPPPPQFQQQAYPYSHPQAPTSARPGTTDTGADESSDTVYYDIS